MIDELKLIPMIRQVVENAYKQGFIDCFSMLRNLPAVSYNMAEQMYGYSFMKAFTKDKKLKHSGNGGKTPILFNIADLEKAASLNKIDSFINN